MEENDITEAESTEAASSEAASTEAASSEAVSAESTSAETASAEERLPPMPPPSFEFLVLSIATQAQMQLGLFHFGDASEESEPDLRMARHSIDLLGVLQEKTKGNLSLEEERLLGNSLTELRFRYVQAQNK